MRGLGGNPHERLHQDSVVCIEQVIIGVKTADCNGAANIITKVSRKLSLDLSQLCRGKTEIVRHQNISLVSARTDRARRITDVA
ncbi:MAG: hypothetical protein SWX82_18430 [Cyanobacteriota bacterium]|nr:hypothetical protein [Cyanobacteriota bacterium]